MFGKLCPPNYIKVGLGENEIVWERFGKYGYDALFEELKLILKTEKENA